MNLIYSKQQLTKMMMQKVITKLQDDICGDEKVHMLQHAKQLLNNTFTFDKPWDMERCLTPYTLPEIDWNTQHNEDEEWCFMLNRLDYLSDLIIAGLLTEEHCYFDKVKYFILHWIAQHQVMKQEPSTRTLDTGIRIMNMMECLPYLLYVNGITDDELDGVLTHLEKQIEYLKNEYQTKYTLSNWGSIQTCAIVSILPLLDEQYALHPIFKWAQEEIKTQFEIQIYEDGLHWEQSTMYHVEVLNYAMKALYYQSFYNFILDPIVQLQTKKMVQALRYQATPKMEIETFGDSDRVSIMDVLMRACILFKTNEWKLQNHTSLDSDSIYMLGSNAATYYDSLPIGPSPECTFDGVDSGLYTIRSSWEDCASFTMFTNGSLGSGHGHSDNLHVSIYHHGIPIFIDSGRYTYRDDHPLRLHLKGMKAHNSLLLDEREFCLPSDSWGYRDFGIPQKNYVRHKQNLHYIEGTLLGHSPLQVLTRKIICIDPSIWCIVDEVKADGEHTLHKRFHADPEITIQKKEQCLHISGEDVLHMYVDGEVHVLQEDGSLRYNERQSHCVVQTSQTFQDCLNSTSILCEPHIEVLDIPVFQGKDIPFPTEVAGAKKFILSPMESYTIVVFHKEVFEGRKICFCEGVPFHAKCVVIHEKNNTKKLISLRT